MSVIPIDFRSNPAKGRFWRALAERLHALAAYPAKHAVSEQELRRIDEDIERCRQLMFPKQRRQRDFKAPSLTEGRQTRVGNG